MIQYGKCHFCWHGERIQCLCLLLLTSNEHFIHTIKPLILAAPKHNTEIFLVSCCCCLYPIYWKQVLSREWRFSWNSADRRCSNYIWVINKFIIPSAQRSWRGYTGFTLSVCGQNLVRSLSSTILTGSILYLYTSYQATSEGVSRVKILFKIKKI